MLPTVLRPVPLAERCYLSEALLWVAVQRFPLQELPAGEGSDQRLDPEYPAGLESPELEPLTDAECLRAGLPPDPSYQEYLSGEYHMQPQHIREMIKLVDDRIADHDRWIEDRKAELARSIAFHRERGKWEEEFEAFTDVYRSRIYLALREERLPALGIRLPRPTIEGAFRYLESCSWPDWGKSEWEPIAANFWISTNIDWDDSYSEGRPHAYCLIQIPVKELLEAFPPPGGQAAEGVVVINEEYVLTRDAPVPQFTGKRGRPSYKWEDFHVEIARRAASSSIPPKQEAFILEMQTWCKKQWGKEVGRSTLLQKIKPYYDGLLRLDPKSKQ